MDPINVEDQLRTIHAAATRYGGGHHPDCVRLEGCVCGLDQRNAAAGQYLEGLTGEAW